MEMPATITQDLPLEEMFVQWRDGCDRGMTLAYVRDHALEGVLRDAHRIARAVTTHPLDVTYFDDMDEDEADPEATGPWSLLSTCRATGRRTTGSLTAPQRVGTTEHA